MEELLGLSISFLMSLVSLVSSTIVTFSRFILPRLSRSAPAMMWVNFVTIQIYGFPGYFKGTQHASKWSYWSKKIKNELLVEIYSKSLVRAIGKSVTHEI